MAVTIDPKVKLRIDDETGEMKFDFDDHQAAVELAEAYGLELDDTFVKLGHCDDMGLPDVYWRSHSARWVRLADAWERDQRERGLTEARQTHCRGAW